MKSECPTFLRSNGKAMVVTLSDSEVSDHKSRSDEDGNFFTFTFTIVINESDLVEENPSDGEFFECADLQEAYNKLCKVAAKDTMSVDLGLKKTATLEHEKKNLLNLLDANELVNKVNTENIMLLDKIKKLELELFVVREQTNRSASSKLYHMLSIQKSPLDKLGLDFVDSISVFETHFTNFVSCSEPSKIEVVKLKEDVPAPRKIRVDLKRSKLKNSNLPKDKKHDRPLWVCHFCGKAGHTCPNCFKLQASKRVNMQKVLVPQAQDPMVLIGKLVKALDLYTNVGVVHHSNMNNNFKIKVASKRLWMQKAQSNCAFLTWSLCFILKSFMTIFLMFLFSFVFRICFALHSCISY